MKKAEKTEKSTTFIGSIEESKEDTGQTTAPKIGETGAYRGLRLNGAETLSGTNEEISA